MRVCPVCGTPVMEGSNFCAKCGAGLRTAPKPRQGVKAGVIAAIIIGGMAVTTILSFLGLAILGFALEDNGYNPSYSDDYEDFDDYLDDFLDDYFGGQGSQGNAPGGGQGSQGGGFGSDHYQGGEDWLFGE